MRITKDVHFDTSFYILKGSCEDNKENKSKWKEWAMNESETVV